MKRLSDIVMLASFCIYLGFWGFATGSTNRNNESTTTSTTSSSSSAAAARQRSSSISSAQSKKMPVGCKTADKKVKPGKRTTSIFGVLTSYQHQHGITVLQNETAAQLCNRKFVMNSRYHLACPSIGNSWSAFLSNAAAGIVLNRTLVAQTQLKGCQAAIELKKWVVTYRQLKPLLEKAGCPLPWSNTPKASYRSVCNSTARVVNFDEINNDAYDYFSPNSPLLVTQRSKTRAKALFSFSSNSSASWRYQAYGLISMVLMRFNRKSREPAAHLVRDLYHDEMYDCKRKQSIITIGVHIHHKSSPTTTSRSATNSNSDDVLIDEEMDKTAMEAIKHIKSLVALAQQQQQMVAMMTDINMKNKNTTMTMDTTMNATMRGVSTNVTASSNNRSRKCVIFIASDRMATIERISAFVKDIDCLPRFVNRPDNATVAVAVMKNNSSNNKNGNSTIVPAVTRPPRGVINGTNTLSAANGSAILLPPPQTAAGGTGNRLLLQGGSKSRSKAVEQGKSSSSSSSSSSKAEYGDGPWANTTIAYSDWFLLSHAEYFIGTASSSFSTIIANGIAARNAIHRTPETIPGNRIWWIESTARSKSTGNNGGSSSSSKGTAGGAVVRSSSKAEVTVPGSEKRGGGESRRGSVESQQPQSQYRIKSQQVIPDGNKVKLLCPKLLL